MTTTTTTENKSAQQLRPVDEVRGAIEKLAPQFKMALPAHISVEKFQRVAITAIAQNADLIAADRTSLYAECMKAAQDGLVPDGREAVLTVFNQKMANGQYKKVVKYMPMVWGIVKKVRNSGELLEIGAHAVYANDEFEYWIDDIGEHLKHRPLIDGVRGDFRLVYAIAKTKDGGRYVEVMTKEQVDQVANVSRSKDKNGNTVGPWKDWYPEQARKTVIRRLSKRLPMSTDKEDEIRRVIERDDDLYDLQQIKNPQATADTLPAPDVAIKRPRGLQHVVDAGAPKEAAPIESEDPAAGLDADTTTDAGPDEVI